MVMSKMYYFDFLKVQDVIVTLNMTSDTAKWAKIHCNDAQMTTDYYNELKICTDRYFHSRNTIVMSEINYFNFVKG